MPDEQLLFILADAVSSSGSGLLARLTLVGISIQGTRLAIHHIGGDDHFLHPIQGGKLEHGFQQNAFQDGAQTARAGTALDRSAAGR